MVDPFMVPAEVCVALNTVRDHIPKEQWAVLLLVASQLSQQLNVTFIYHPSRGFVVQE